MAALQIRKQCRVLIPDLLGMVAQNAFLGEEWRACLLSIQWQRQCLAGRTKRLRRDTLGL